MDSTTSLHVAIYNDEGVYKYWGLLIEGPTVAEMTILNIMGSSSNYRFEMRASDPRKSATIFEVIYLCDVSASNIATIKKAAANMPIHNEFPG